MCWGGSGLGRGGRHCSQLKTPPSVLMVTARASTLRGWISFLSSPLWAVWVSGVEIPALSHPI